MIDFANLYEIHNDEYLKDENIRPERVLHRRPDIMAFLLLDRLCPGTRDMVCHAGHEEIWLDVEVADLNAVATGEDALDLIRCGVRYDSSNDSLAMFV